jgi:hypothetical protein
MFQSDLARGDFSTGWIGPKALLQSPTIARLARTVLGIGEPRRRLDRTAARPCWGWLPALSLSTAGSLLMIALALGEHGPTGQSGATWLFCGGIFLLIFPIAARIAWPSVSRFERIGLLILTTVALYLVKILASPLGFSGFDEFLHWVTAQDILSRQKLFTPNALLPVSPLYPALEIATTAIASITGLTLFASALVFIGIVRVAFICALFLFFQTITASSRIAALACFIYMSNSSFLIFHASFAYESLAIALIALVFLAMAFAHSDVRSRRIYFSVLAVPFLLALATTHHATALIGTLLLVALAVLILLNRHAPGYRLAIIAIVLTAMLSSWGWSRLMGDPISEYLASDLQRGLDDLHRMIVTLTPVRKPFVSMDGSTVAAWQWMPMLGALVLICLGLAAGFFRTLTLAGVRLPPRRGQRRLSIGWTSNWLILIAILSAIFPLTQIFRLTESAWELGNRLGPFLYFGIAPVVAVALASLWQDRSASPGRAAVVATVLTLILSGGIFASWGGPIELPRRYKVVADALSIEPMGIGAAQWTEQWLGTGHRFAADRVNRLLLAAHGRQQVVTTLHDQVDTSGVLFARSLTPEELHALKASDTDYLLVDMRMTEALPRVGVYFERGEDPQVHAEPPEPAALLKFNRMRQVSRPFDNGYIIIYDVTALVKALHHAR